VYLYSLAILATLVSAAHTVWAAPSTGPLLEATGNIDGKAGDEVIRLDRDGTLTAGAASISIALEPAELDSHPPRHMVAVIPLGGKRRGVLVQTASEQVYDSPPDRVRVFLYTKGTLRLVFDEAVPVKFSKKGVGRYLESGDTACEREYRKHPDAVLAKKTVKLYTVSLRLNPAGTKLVKRLTLGKDVMVCDEENRSACPYVYELGDVGPRFAGEILRDLRYARSEALQSLGLGGRTAGIARIRLAEEKPETTYIDEVYVVVDGTRIAPKTCAQVPSPAYCFADGRYYVMVQGDTLDLDFAVAAGTRSLFARGYYVPY